IRAGEPVEFLYLVVDGAFDVTVSAPDEHRVATIYAGELMGEMSFVDSHPPSATVTASMNSGILAVHKGELTAKIKNDVGFAARFYQGIAHLLSDRLRAAYADEIDLREFAAGKDEMSTLATRF